MKLISIRLGKALKIIQQDGLLASVQRGWGYLLKYLRATLNSKSGQVLIITGGVGSSADYRAYHVAEELNLHNIKTEVIVQGNPFFLNFVDKFSVFVFNRIPVTPVVEKFIEKIKKQNKEIIFETDDLVFDVKYMHATDAYAKMSSLEKKQYEKGVGEEILQDPYVEICTTTTTFLAKILESYGKKVFLVPNKLSNNDLKIAEKALNNKCHSGLDPESSAGSIEMAKILNQVQDDKEIRIGYFSGTMSHNRDFATIVDALVSIMEKHSQVKLVLAGPLEIGNALDKFQDRIVQLPFVSRAKHFENLSQVDINLAPLELGDPYCEAKSELKFFEAGIVGVPTVAVANQTFSEAIVDGVDGFLAKDTTEWVEKLSKLIKDKDFRIAMGEKAREKVLQKYTNKNSTNEEYYSYLRHRMSNAQ